MPPNKSLKKHAWLMATTLLAGGTYMAWHDDNTPQDRVKLVAHHPAEETPTARISDSSLPFQTAASGKNSPQNKYMFQDEGVIKEDKITDNDSSKISNTAKLARHFFMRYLKAQTWTDKMDNLRWAVTQFGDVKSPDTVEKAAQGLLLKKEDLAKILGDTAQAMFKQGTYPNAASRFDQMSYWNDLRMAFPFAGLDEQGAYSESRTTANTGYTLDQLTRNRDSFTISAAAEIAPSIRETVLELDRLREQYKAESGESIGASWRHALESLPHEKKLALRDHIDLLTYVLERQLGGGTDENLQMLGLNEEIYAHLERLKYVLDDPIYDKLLDWAKQENYSPKAQLVPENLSAKGLSFPDIVPQLFTNPLFYKPH